jgi:mRNA-degrading endonuclease RelE of RelBE toxin-antitoxin system
LQEVNKLAEDPFGGNTKKLFDTAYRRRVGNWRIIFTADFKTNTIRVFLITRRNEKTYKGLY